MILLFLAAVIFFVMGLMLLSFGWSTNQRWLSWLGMLVLGTLVLIVTLLVTGMLWENYIKK